MEALKDSINFLNYFREGSFDHFDTIYQTYSPGSNISIREFPYVKILLLSTLVLYTLWYFLYKADKLQLYYSETPFHKYIVNSCPHLHKTYYPPIWMFNSHLQGALGLVLREKLNFSFKTEIVKTKDGSSLILNFSYAPNPSDTTPIVLILPGVTGGCDKPYISHLVSEANKRNYHAVVLILPGCIIKGDEINMCTAPRFYSPLETSDVQTAIDYILRVLPNSPLIGVGHSMGAAMLVKYLGSEHGQTTKMKACISLSNPWDFIEIAKNMQDSFINRNIYNRHFFSYWINVYKKNAHIFKDVSTLNHEEINKATCVHDFEDRISRVLYGFPSLEEYLSQCSCSNSIEKLKIPLFVIHAMDDPVVPLSAFPFHQLRTSENMFTAITKSGGHSGWLEGHFNCRGICFADELSMQFIDAVLARNSTSSNDQVLPQELRNENSNQVCVSN